MLCIPAVDEGCINTLPLHSVSVADTYIHIGFVSEQLNVECDFFFFFLPNQDHTCPCNTDVNSYSCFRLEECVSVVSLINVILH